ncbi:MAG: hypothetical protein J2P19_04555 [Pseudonocardia sp.]|nr:hypothetical protein [Pseudonocardia sp.]
MTAATYGTVHHDAHGWRITAAPHVMIKVRRLFPRADRHTSGAVTLADTTEVARDIAWLMSRYPLDMTDDVAARLIDRAEQHRAAERTVRAILDGYSPPVDWPEPARTPRPYQQQAADIVHALGQLLLVDDLGLGKTFTGLLVLRDPEALPALVVAPAHLPPQWLRELDATLPWLRGHILTSTTPYDPASRFADGEDPDVLITSYSKLAGWADHLAGQVRTVIFDEAQELRRGTTTEKGKAAAQIALAADFRLGLTATPVYNYGDEIYNVLSLLAPDILGDWPEFLREWGGGTRGPGGHVLVSDPAALGTYLRDQGVMLRRSRADVGRQIPEPIKVTQPVDTDHAAIDQVAGDVAAMAELLLTDDTTPAERMTAAGEVDWRMRQATGIAKARFVAEFVRLLLDSEPRVLLFGWHRDVYDIWLDALAEYRPVLYTGSETPAQKNRHADAFCAGDARVLIMSLRAGAGIDGLQEVASAAVFGELDWSPGVHEQCIGRLWRDGQSSAVVAYYLVSNDGTDPLMAETLGIKQQQANQIRDPNTDLFRPVSANTDRTRQLARSILDRRHTSQRPPQPARLPVTWPGPVGDGAGEQLALVSAGAP